MKKLERLKQELQETKILLKSPRVSSGTRYVLEQLKQDLEKQIAKLEKGEESPSEPPVPEPESAA